MAHVGERERKDERACPRPRDAGARDGPAGRHDIHRLYDVREQPNGQRDPPDRRGGRHGVAVDDAAHPHSRVVRLVPRRRLRLRTGRLLCRRAPPYVADGIHRPPDPLPRRRVHPPLATRPGRHPRRRPARLGHPQPLRTHERRPSRHGPPEQLPRTPYRTHDFDVRRLCRRPLPLHRVERPQGCQPQPPLVLCRRDDRWLVPRRGYAPLLELVDCCGHRSWDKTRCAGNGRARQARRMLRGMTPTEPQLRHGSMTSSRSYHM
ncbi:uncharacterized protein COLE_07675 [Cutaneotrichosporon oleaginosum]|uniref:uncharacterized protein n=1 Tax=Cutaneotrichosporon oleaginosum TaxID=879819 RepID=UPI0013249CEA|nr:hypothetical protein COLE_07675 [Cutaneotrichosporon oleaginosum]